MQNSFVKSNVEFIFQKKSLVSGELDSMEQSERKIECLFCGLFTI